MTQIKIRLARPKDHQPINRLFRESYIPDANALPDTYKEIPEILLSKDIYLNTLKDGETAIFVAEESGKIIGVIDVSIERDEGDDIVKPYHRASIEELCVEKEISVNDVRALLIDKTLDWAKEKGVEYLTTIPYCYDKKTVTFYKNNGFEPYSVRLNKKIGDEKR